MAYVRRHGKQLEVVHGERDLETGKVEQRVLFTFYSKPEALAAAGAESSRFRSLLEGHHPEIRFDWKKLGTALQRLGRDLPGAYVYGDERLRRDFRDALCAFTRQLVQADPQWRISAARLLEQHRHELEYVAELIQWRLRLTDQEESEWNRDDEFHWQGRMQGPEVPPEAEEHAANLYEKRELDRAEAVFRLLVECYPRYAEGYNYLGLIALERSRPADALPFFEGGAALGRRLFRRVPRRDYWRDHRTRPYMRSLRNLAFALNWLGRSDEAMAVCGRLERECGERAEVEPHRAVAALNAGRWDDALALARSQGVVEALALAEMGREGDAVGPFLREAIGSPRLARLLAGVRQDEPREFAEVADHNAGVWLWRQTTPYRSRQSPRARRLVARLVRHPRVAALLDEVRDLRRKMGTREDEAAYRAAFDRHHDITGAVFGDRLAAEIEPDLGYRRPAMSAQRLAAMPCPSRHPM